MRRLAAVTLFIAALPAFADAPLQDARHWLERMTGAARTVSFHGEIVHLHGNRARSMEITRYSDGENVIERLLVLDGPPREVIRDGKQITCIVPDGIEQLEGERVPRNPFPGKNWKHSETLAEHYEFLELGTDRVAGRECRVIGIKPRDGFRYGYRLWIDQDTGLLLKSSLLDAQGEVIEQVAFTRISINDSAAAERVHPTLEGEHMRWRVGERAPAAESVSIRVEEVPDGYVAHSSPRQRGRKVVQHTFTDGLASVSVFVEPRQPARNALEGPSRMGAVSAHGTVHDDWQVTVVGEVPSATVELIAESVRVSPGAQ